MVRFVLLILLLANFIVCHAQEEYRINGKIDGISVEYLFLISDEGGQLDTLGTARIVNGVFEFRGSVDAVRTAYIVSADQNSIVPIILENTQFMINMNNRRALVKGGEQQEILAQFSKLNADLMQKQNAIQQEYRQAEQGGDKEKVEELQKSFETAITEARAEEEVLLRKYADTYVAAYVVAAVAHQLEVEMLKERYALLGDAAKRTIPGRSVAALIADMEKFTEGNIVPDFTVISQTGDSLSLYSVKGKLKLLVFWESIDPSCRSENVNLLDIYQKYRLRGLEIISISRDSNIQAWEKAINTDAMFWKQGIDPNAVIFDRYHVKRIPYALLLDEENRIIAKDLKGNELRKKIVGLLKKK